MPLADNHIGPEVIFKIFNNKHSMGTEQSEQTLLIKLDHFWRTKEARAAQAAELWLIISDTVRIFQYFNNWCGGCICEPFQGLSQLKRAMPFWDCCYCSVTELSDSLWAQGLQHARLHCPSLSPGGGSDGKESAWNVGDPVSVPGLERSPGEGNGNPLQYSCLENPMDRRAWRATVLGVAKTWTQLSN